MILCVSIGLQQDLLEACVINMLVLYRERYTMCMQYILVTKLHLSILKNHRSYIGVCTQCISSAYTIMDFVAISLENLQSM